MRRGLIVVGLLLLVGAGFVFASGAEETAAAEQELESVSLRLNFLPSTQYAGYYIAKWNGFFEEEGLDVTILAAGQELNSAQMVASGGDTFGIGEPHLVLTSRHNGVPLVHIFQEDADSYLRYVAKRSTGIREVADLKGKTISLWLGGGEWEMMSMLKRAGLDPNRDVEVVAQRVGMVPFFEDQVDMAQATTFNELQQIFQAGYSEDELVIFRAADYNSGLLGNGVFTLQETIEDRPEMVQGFVNGAARGWKWALDNPEETVAMFLEEFPDLEEAGQVIRLEQKRILMLSREEPATTGIGYLGPEYFEEAQSVLVGNDLIEPVNINEAFASEFWANVPDEYKIVD